jgi:hypothetical protein
MLRSLALVACLAVSGCATLVTGNSQTLTLDTQPVGAACIFKRDGVTIGAVNPTPGSVSVDKSYKDIDVVCSKEGYRDAAGRVGSSFQPMTFGNVLFGGLVGIVIDAASGAVTQYEPTLTVVLIPASFESAAARDAFFEQRRANYLAQAEAVRKRIEQRCSPNDRDCARQLAEAKAAEQKGLAQIEQEREAANLQAPPR